jgi:hypothetical protein
LAGILASKRSWSWDLSLESLPNGGLHEPSWAIGAVDRQLEVPLVGVVHIPEAGGSFSDVVVGSSVLDFVSDDVLLTGFLDTSGDSLRLHGSLGQTWVVVLAVLRAEDELVVDEEISVGVVQDGLRNAGAGGLCAVD